MVTAKNEARDEGGTGIGRSSSRDTALAKTLLDLRQRLSGITYAAYLPMADVPALGVAMAVDTPCSFTLPTEMSLLDLRQPTVRAYQTSKVVVSYPKDRQNLVQRVPQFFLHAPFPMAVVSAPIISGDTNFGCLNVRWSRTWTPDEPVDAHDVDIVRRAAESVANELLTLANAGIPMNAPTTPKFIPPIATRSRGETAEVGSGLTGGVSGTTFLYQLKRLSTELAGAVELGDVLIAAQRYVMEPLGAEALMLCRLREERLRVVGSVGYNRDEVEKVEGTPLSRSTPETDTVNRAEAGLHELSFPHVRGEPTAPASPTGDAPRLTFLSLQAVAQSDVACSGFLLPGPAFLPTRKSLCRPSCSDRLGRLWSVCTPTRSST